MNEENIHRIPHRVWKMIDHVLALLNTLDIADDSWYEHTTDYNVYMDHLPKKDEPTL